MDLMESLAAIPGIGKVMPYIIAAIALASLLAPAIPPEWGPVYRIINILAANVGKARNATDPKVNP